MRKTKVWAVLKAAMLGLGLIFVSCNPNTIDKTKVETGAITGKAYYSNSDDSSGIIITLDKTDGLVTTATVNAISTTTINYYDDASRAVVSQNYTGSDGSYSFNNLAAGTYTVYASSASSTQKAVCTNVVVESGRSVTAADLKLVATGSIVGEILLDGTETGNTGFLVFVAGTSFMAMTADDGSFEISGVPAGQNYQLVVMKGDLTYSISSKITVKADSETIIATQNFTSDEIESGVKTGSDGVDGTDGKDGVDGADGKDGIDGKDGADGADGKDGVDGKDGTSMVWLGAFASADEIEEPEYLNAYFNTTDGCSYIYDGTQWTLLAKSGANGSDGVDGKDGEGTTSYVTATATDRGISFSGTIPSNVYFDYTDYTNYSTRTYTNQTTTAKCNIRIVENNSRTIMVKDWSLTSSENNNWNMVYPLVEAGKNYSFTVTVAWYNYTFYKENFTIEATGGLGEYEITNKDSYTTELTADRVIQRTGIPEFTDNPNVEVEEIGIKYLLYRYEGSEANGNGDKLNIWNGTWLYEFTNWSSLENNTLPLKDVYYYSGWRDYDYLNNMLSGKRYGIATSTKIKIAGYSENGNIYFEMADSKGEIGDWGGDVVKELVVYGCYDPENLNYAYKTEDLNYSEPLSGGYTLTKNATNLPGSSVTATVNGEEVTYPYAQIVDFNDTIYEPTCEPAYEFTLNGNKVETNPYKFKSWSATFPYVVSDTATTAVIDGEEYYVTYISASFKTLYDYTLNYCMNDGTSDIFYTQYINSESGAAGYSWQGAVHVRFPIEEPVRDGYEFGGWYLDSDCTDKAYEGDSIVDWVYDDSVIGLFDKSLYSGTVSLYAKWLKDITITYMMNDGSTDTAGTAELTELDDVSTGISAPERVGYCFKGWYLDAECTNQATTVSEDTIVYAKWLEAITVTYMMNDGSTDEAGTAELTELDDVSTGITAPVRDGYCFKGWYLDAECTNQATTVSEDTIVYAKWAGQGYTITCVAQSWGCSGSVQVDLPEVITVAEGDVYTIKGNVTIGTPTAGKIVQFYVQDCLAWGAPLGYNMLADWGDGLGGTTKDFEGEWTVAANQAGEHTKLQWVAGWNSDESNADATCDILINSFTITKN